jgi:hypothetical protein
MFQLVLLQHCMILFSWSAYWWNQSYFQKLPFHNFIIKLQMGHLICYYLYSQLGTCILSLKGSCLFKSFSEGEMLFRYFRTAYIKTNDTLNFKWMTFYSITNNENCLTIFLFATHYQVHTEIIKMFHTNCWDAHWRWLEANLVDRTQAAKASGSRNGLITGVSVTGLLANFSSLSSVLGKSNKIHN